MTKDLIKTGKFGREMGRFLTSLKDDRESADYELFANVDKAQTETAITEADRLLAEARGYLKTEGFVDWKCTEPPDGQPGAGIRWSGESSRSP
jgi:hypothetical protein